MNYKRENFESYADWRAACSSQMEQVISEADYARYRVLFNESYPESNSFFDSVMNLAAVERNIATAKRLEM